MIKRHLIIAVAVVLLILAVPLFGVLTVMRPLPRLDGNETISALDKSASVAFDGHAVPYIEAHTDSDAYVAQGYITARDRMFQMDMLRRSALGQMSEVYGSSWLPTDRLMRTLGIKKLAYAEFNKLTPPARAALESYASGVNAYLSGYEQRLPLQFLFLGYTPRTWRAEDSLAILKYQAYRSDESWRLDDFRQRVSNTLGQEDAAQLFRDDLVAYGPPAKEEKPAGDAAPSATPDGHLTPSAAAPHQLLLSLLARQADQAHRELRTSPLMGSTTWAIPAQATSTRGAMLACNTDGPLNFPSDWYLASVNSPGMHVAGATMPGVPGIMIGRNENMGWGASALKADVQDIFLEQFKSQFDNSYQTAKGWKEAELETETIPVRFGKDVEHRLWVTEHGPVLLRSNQSAVSLSWTGFDTDKPSFEVLYHINRAASADEFVLALSKFNDPPMMFVFADRWGNVGAQGAGMVPVRAGGGNGTMLNVGWEIKGAWQSMVPFEKLPRAVVPASTSDGASRAPVIAANQKPCTNGHALPAMDAGVALGHQWAPPYRANRLLAALTNNKQRISPADMIALAGDQYTELGSVVGKTLAQAAQSNHIIDRNSVYAVELLSHWDGELRADTIEGSLYQAYLQTLSRRLTEAKLGRPLSTEYMLRWPMWLVFSQSAMQNKPAAWLPPEERTYDCFFMTTLTQSLKSLRIAFDTSSPVGWTWGKIHKAVFEPIGGDGHSWFAGLYRLGPVAVGGAPECINSCDVAFDRAALRFNSSNGPTQRTIIDMSDHAKFYESINTGQSSHFASPYSSDQMKAWTKVDLLPIAFSSDQLLKQIAHRLTLDNQ